MPWHLGIRTTVFAAGIAVWHKILAEKRGAVCSRAFRRTLFTRNRKPTLLKDVETGIDHVLCATDLHAGEHVYFAGSFVYSYRFGLGKPAGLPLATAVQVSAAFPGAFAPRVLKTAPHEFDGNHRAERTMVLTDGGVYDNMAEQWAVGLVARNERLKSSRFKQVEELVVVNSSATMPWHALGRLRLPLVGEVFALAEIVNTLYDNTTSPRRSALVQRFDEAAKSGIGLRGALVTIDQTPYTVADYFVKSTTWPDRASRANAVLTMLQNERKEEWERITDENRHTATTFGTFGTQRSAQLIYHAYVVAMMNLHIVLDYPLLPMPTRKEFEDFVS
jgi:predicted acylesterase/phospholipase RssA